MKRFFRFREACSFLIVALAALALWSWVAGVGELFTLGPQHVPMAPSTALLLLLLGTAVFLRSRWPLSRLVTRLGYTVAGMVSVAGLLVCARQRFGWNSPLEEWLSQTSDRIGNIPLGQMSPATGAAFAAVAVSFILGLPPQGRRSVGRWSAGCIALAVALLGAGVAFSYTTHKPWFSDGDTIPMALATAFAFVLFGLSLFAASLVSNPEPELAVSRQSNPPLAAPEKTLGAVPVTISILLAVVFSVLGALYLRSEQTEIRTEAREEMKAIGDLKTAQLVHWREERLSDARFFASAGFVARDVENFLFRPVSERSRTELLNWLKLLKAGDRYAMVALFDTNGVLRLALPEQTNAPTALMRQLTEDAHFTNRLFMSDLHCGSNDRDIHIDIVFPVFAAEAGSTALSPPSPNPKQRQPLGVVLLRMDPRRFLYPLIQSWPTPSPTAETALIRREGNEAVLLNELRHRTNTPLAMRFTIDPTSDSPAVKAVLGQTGLVEGRDYRGVPVLAEIRRVPDSPWFLLVKVDRNEIYGRLQHQAWLVLALTLVMAITGGLGTSLVWKYRDATFVRKELADERQRLALAQRVEHLLKNANDAIMLADEHSRILEANDRAQELYGYSLGEMQAMELPALRAPETLVDFFPNAERLKRNGQATFDTLHQRKDGSVFPVEISSSVIEIGGVRYRLGFLRDITQRKAQEREIDRLTRLYSTLSQVNQSIVRLRSREELFQEVCRITAAYGCFKVVWIGWHDRETLQVKPIAHAGECNGYLDKIKVTTGDRPEGHGPVGTCIREGKACVFNDFINDERAAAWHEAAVARELRSVVALPIRFEGEVCGALAVYASEPGIFLDKEIALLEEIALDVSFALDHLAQEEKHRAAETALHESEAKLRALVENIPQKIFIKDRQSRYVYINENYARDLGIRPADVVGKEDYEFYPKELADQYRADDRRIVETGRTEHLEEKYLQSGKEVWIHTIKTPLRDKDGAIMGLCGIFHDITERKRNEEVLRESEAFTRAVLDNLPVGIAVNSVGPSVRFNYMNDRFPEFYRTTREKLANPDDFWSAVYEDPEFREEMRKRVLEDCAGGDVERMRWTDVPITRKGEETVFVTARNIPLRDSQMMISIVWDVTERKRTEAALRESEELYRSLVSASPDSISVTDIEGRIVYVSPKALEMFGLATVAEASGRSIMEWISSPEHELAVENILHLLTEGRLRDTEYSLVRKDGTTFSAEINAGVLRAADGNPKGMIFVTRDITERKRAEEQVRTLSRAVEQSATSIVITNPAGEIEYVNPKFTELTGYTLEESRGKNPSILKTGGTPAAAYEQLWRTIRHGQTWRGEFQNRKKNGELFWELASISPVLDAAGGITHFIAVKEDITERKRAEAALRESERRLREMMENVQMVTIMLEERGQVLFCNDYLLQLTGWQREEVLGRNYFDIFIPAGGRDELRQVYQSLMQGTSPLHYENEIVTRNGERRLISWNNSSLKDMAGKTIGVASLGEDITKRKSLESQLRQAQKMEAIGQLAGGVAHDFNNILAATMMHLGLLQMRSDLDGELRESLAELVSHAERAASLTRQLLLFSRRSVMQVQPLDLNEIVESLLRMLRRIIGEQIDLDWRGKAQLPAVSGDAGMMDQVIMNLVVNARDALPMGGRITVATEAVEVDDSLASANPDARPGKFVCLSVADTGCGMDETVLKRIFEPFFTTKEAGKGTGLGLATVYGIASQHKGWVTVESEVGKGSTFRIYLPVVAGEISEATSGKIVQPVQPGHETILLVEDDPSVRKMIRGFLRHYGYEVIEAANGLEALTLWEANQARTALLFTDMVMPNGLNGLELTEKLRATKPELKVIISSGYSCDLLQESDLAGKGIVFLPKPCPSRELVQAVRRCLDKS